MEVLKEWQEYERGKDYNNKLTPSYYSTVDKNYRFYSNDQWHGVKSNGLPTPVFNFLKQIVDYKIQSIVSQKVKMQYGVEYVEDDTEDPQGQELQRIASIISGHSEIKWEKLKMDSLIREGLLDGAISGDVCLYTYWDANIDTGQTYGKEATEMGAQPVKIMGDFVTELVDGGNVFFANPNSNKVQNQPYILIAGREVVSVLKERAKANGISDEEINKIVPDNDYTEQAGDRGKIELDSDGDNGKTTYLIKLWKKRSAAPLREPDKVMMKIITRAARIQDETDTELKLYPIAWTNWDILKNSYHGQAEVTGLIPNQIAVNQLFSMILYHMRMTAFGKVVYDRSRIRSWNNTIGAAIGVDGDIRDVATQLQPGQMNNMVVEVFNQAISMTKDLSGANDAALGNVDPKNTSAIIAVQKQSSVPLEGIKARLYQLVEDLGLIWLDFMVNKYGVERKIAYKESEKEKIASFKGTDYKDIPWKIKIDVGPSSYWSEITSMQTLDNLLNSEKINFIQYLDRIPNGMIPKKQELIDELKAQIQNNDFLYGQMAKFVESLPPDIQASLQELQQKDPQVYEQQVKELMMQGNEPMMANQSSGGMM